MADDCGELVDYLSDQDVEEALDEYTPPPHITLTTNDDADDFDAAPPRSPCSRSRDTLYDLVPALELHERYTADTPLEAQLVDITFRDHALPAIDARSPQWLAQDHFADAITEDVDTAPTALRIDLHLVDASGRSITATVGGDDGLPPFRTRVHFQSIEAGVASDARVLDLRQAIARRLELAPDAIHYETSQQASLIGFDPKRNDPLQRMTYTTVSFGFDTAECAARARRLEYSARALKFELLDRKRDVAIEFMIERGLDACGWVLIRRARIVPPHRRTSAAQLEVVCAVEDVGPSERVGLAPMLTATYDIETFGSRGAGVFPDASVEGDYVCAVTTCFWRAGRPENERFSVVMVVGDAGGADYGHDVAVECYATERELLCAWGDLLRRSRPSVLVSYNGFRFDNPYLSTRARLRCNGSARDRRAFWHFGAHVHQPVVDAQFRLESNAFGVNEGSSWTVGGTVVVDVMQYVSMNYKLPLYSLNFVAKHFLGGGKTDLDIPTMFRLVEAGRFRRLVQYVTVDGERTQELLSRLKVIASVWEMSRATSTLPTDVLTRGQQIRVMNRLRRTCATECVAIRQPPKAPKRRFIGASVVTPRARIYNDDVIITLDFASLYPSLIKAYNLCYQTWIEPARVDEVRRQFPDLELVSHELRLGQVWEPCSMSSLPMDAPELPRASAIKLADAIGKQREKGCVDIAFTEDEFSALVEPLVRMNGGLTTEHFVRVPSAVKGGEGAGAKSNTSRFDYYRPKVVKHTFAKGVPDPSSPSGEARCPSLLPQILEDLGKLRKEAKKRMGAAEAAVDTAEAAGDAEGAAVQREQAALFDKEQLSYKVVMNSLYGFTAADTLRLLALSETITALGRRALQDSIRIAEAKCAEMGFEGEVVYGDTDSIFVNVRGATTAEALDVGACISEACNDHFARVTKSRKLVLEFEALFENMILIGKKTYAGLQHAVHGTGERVRRTYGGVEVEFEAHGMNPKPKKYKKGMRAVRRDTCPFVGRTQGESIDVFLETRSVEKTLAYIEDAAMRLVRSEVPLQDFQITMQLKRESDYAKDPNDAVAKQPHLRLVKKLEQRSREGPLPQGCHLYSVGSRVAYYYAETDEEIGCDRAECPVYGGATGVRADRVHYFDLLRKALKQGLGALAEVEVLMERIERQHVVPLRDELKRRRRQLAERRRTLATTHNIQSFFGRASGGRNAAPVLPPVIAPVAPVPPAHTLCSAATPPPLLATDVAVAAAEEVNIANNRRGAKEMSVADNDTAAEDMSAMNTTIPPQHKKRAASAPSVAPVRRRKQGNIASFLA